MRLHHPFNDGDRRRIQLMKGLGRVVSGPNTISWAEFLCER